MAFQHPKRVGFAFSHKSCTIMIGSFEVGGIMSCSGTASIDGAEDVRTNRMTRYAETRGDLVCEAELDMPLEAKAEFLRAYPQILTQQFESFLMVWEEGSERHSLEFVNLRFRTFPINSEGTGPVVGAMSATADSVLFDGQPLISENDE